MATSALSKHGEVVADKEEHPRGDGCHTSHRYSTSTVSLDQLNHVAWLVQSRLERTVDSTVKAIRRTNRLVARIQANLDRTDRKTAGLSLKDTV